METQNHQDKVTKVSECQRESTHTLQMPTKSRNNDPSCAPARLAPTVGRRVEHNSNSAHTCQIRGAEGEAAPAAPWRLTLRLQHLAGTTRRRRRSFTNRFRSFRP